MNFHELCADFSKRRPQIEAGTVPYISIEWTNGAFSSSDLLRTYLNAHKIPYLNDFSGKVWFLFDGDWTYTKVRYDAASNTAHFSRCLFQKCESEEEEGECMHELYDLREAQR